MEVLSALESNDEIDPYWLAVKVNELHGLGNPVRILASNTDSLLDLDVP